MKRDKTRTEVHHRLPKSRGGDNSSRNLSIVPRHLHRYYHALFENKTSDEIAEVLNTVWLSEDNPLVSKSKLEELSNKYSNDFEFAGVIRLFIKNL